MAALTIVMRETLRKISSDWGPLPAGMGCANRTLEGLEVRGLIEMRIKPGTEHKMFGPWECRKKEGA